MGRLARLRLFSDVEFFPTITTGYFTSNGYLAESAVVKWFVVLLLMSHSAMASSGGSSCSKLVDKMPNSTCYDKDLRPQFGAIPRQADLIGFGIHVYQIGPVSEATMSMSSDLYVRASWRDHRLQAMAERLSVNGSADDTVIVKGHYAAAIWRPNIYFVDALEEHTPSEISQSKITLLKTNGEVLSSTRILIKTRCPMNLKMFPMDTQECPVCFSSYMYNDAEQQIYWLEDSVEMNSDLETTATFYISPDMQHFKSVNQWTEGGNNSVSYTTLCLTIKFHRKFDIYVVTMFLPSISLVFLSWVSFCIDKGAVPARAGISITTILAQITLITGTANKFPGISDLKAGDFYMFGNFFFVFGSLVEFALVHSSVQRKIRKNKRKQVEEQNNKNSVIINNKDYLSCEMGDLEDGKNDVETPDKKRARFRANRAKTQLELKLKKRNFDYYALILFPSAFIIWHACFAAYCLKKLDYSYF